VVRKSALPGPHCRPESEASAVFLRRLVVVVVDAHDVVAAVAGVDSQKPVSSRKLGTATPAATITATATRATSPGADVVKTYFFAVHGCVY